MYGFHNLIKWLEVSIVNWIVFFKKCEIFLSVLRLECKNICLITNVSLPICVFVNSLYNIFFCCQLFSIVATLNLFRLVPLVGFLTIFFFSEGCMVYGGK